MAHSAPAVLLEYKTAEEALAGAAYTMGEAAKFAARGPLPTWMQRRLEQEAAAVEQLRQSMLISQEG